MTTHRSDTAADRRAGRRRRTATVLVGALLAAVLSLLVQGTAQACTCMPQDAAAEVEAAGVIFVGTPTGRTDAQEPDPELDIDAAAWTFDVETVHRGTVGATTTVASATNSAACGITFREGEKYLVLGTEVDGELRAGLCSGTGLLANADADRLELIGAGTAPQQVAAPQDTGPSAWPFVAGAAGLLLLAGVVVLVLRRRRQA